MLKTVHLPTASAREKVFRISARLFHEAFLAMRNQASSGPSRSACLVTASLSRLRLMTCMPLLTSSHYANIILRRLRRCQYFCFVRTHQCFDVLITESHKGKRSYKILLGVIPLSYFCPC